MFSEVKNRWYILVQDDRSLAKRAALVFPPCLLLVFSLLWFGPFALFRANQDFLEFTMNDLMKLLIPVETVLLALLVGTMLLLRGKLMNYALSVILASPSPVMFREIS